MKALRGKYTMYQIKKKLGLVFLYAIAVIGVLILLTPIFWMISSSLKSAAQIYTYPIVWFPKPAMWSNYLKAIKAFPFFRYMMNTFIISGGAIIGDILSCSLVAYSFARLRFPGRDPLFLVFLGTIMIPYPVTAIPTYLIWRRLGLIDTYFPLIIPAYTAYPIWTFFVRQYFSTIPLSLDESAKIDGAGFFTIYWKILMPLAKPALISIAMFSFVFHWNDLFFPLIYLNSPEKYPLSLGLASFEGLYFTRWELLMAACTLTLLPPVVLFFLMQKHYIRGIVLTGIKG